MKGKARQRKGQGEMEKVSKERYERRGKDKKEWIERKSAER